MDFILPTVSGIIHGGMIFTWLTTFGQTHQETKQQGLELSDDGYPQIC